MSNNEILKVRKTTTEVKGIEITFDEYYKINSETGEEIFDREIEIQNDARLFDIYKKQKGLLTSLEIKNIRKKYGMNQKEYALAIGVGEVTVNRFENGAIQTEATDAIMRLSQNPDNMYDLLNKNKTNIQEDSYNVFIKIVNELRELKEHRIADIDKKDFLNLKFKTEDVNVIADNIIKNYNIKYEKINKKYNIETDCEYITNLKLQKLLYYTQGVSLHIYGKPAFNNKINAWAYGPVIEEIYYKYREKGRMPINTPNNIERISEGIEKIIDIVIDSYGKYDAGCLIDLTHKETPWKETARDCEISNDLIREYFDKVYCT